MASWPRRPFNEDVVKLLPGRPILLNPPLVSGPPPPSTFTVFLSSFIPYDVEDLLDVLGVFADRQTLAVLDLADPEVGSRGWAERVYSVIVQLG